MRMTYWVTPMRRIPESSRLAGAMIVRPDYYTDLRYKPRKPAKSARRKRLIYDEHWRSLFAKMASRKH